MKKSIRITGFWLNESKDGTRYLSCAKLNEETIQNLTEALQKFGTDAKILLFPNGFKEENKKSPDYNMIIADASQKKDE